jgi:hypothetical protein
MLARFTRWLQILAVVGAILCSAPVEAATAYAEYPAVVCTADASGPFTVLARGTLRRAEAKKELEYRLKVNGRTYEWRFIVNSDQSTTMFTPGFLTDSLIKAPHKEEAPRFPRGPINVLASSGEPTRQSLNPDGEILEHRGTKRLWAGRGNKCPT